MSFTTALSREHQPTIEAQCAFHWTQDTKSNWFHAYGNDVMRVAAHQHLRPLCSNGVRLDQSWSLSHTAKVATRAATLPVASSLISKPSNVLRSIAEYRVSERDCPSRFPPIVWIGRNRFGSGASSELVPLRFQVVPNSKRAASYRFRAWFRPHAMPQSPETRVGDRKAVSTLTDIALTFQVVQHSQYAGLALAKDLCEPGA